MSLQASDLAVLAKRHAAALYGPPDVVFVRGEGAWLIDAAGRRYLDFAGGMGVNFLGHAHPDVSRAVHRQVDLLLHTSNAFLTPAPVQLAARLAQLMDGKQSFFVNAGTEAIEGALKLARRYHALRGQHRPRFVAFARSFHGRTFGAMSVTGQPKMHEGFAPLLPEVTFVPYNDVGALAQAMGEDVAAVVVEPVQGNGGVVVPEASYLATLGMTAHAHGALVICDEVQTGMGRCGAWRAAKLDGLDADITCLAKALGGGLPLGAVVASAPIMDAFSVGAHGSTFGGNPVACAAALAVIDAIEAGDLLGRARALERTLHAALRTLPKVATVRGRGLLVGLHLPTLDLAAVRRACLAEGLLTTQAGTDVLRLFVPAVIDDETLESAYTRLRRALDAVPEQERQ